MNAADIAILAVLAISALFGLMRGFVAAMISLLSWAAAFWAAWVFGDALAQFYAVFLHNHMAQVIAGYLTAFIAVLVIGALFGWMMRKLMQGGGLSGGDRFLGFLFGFGRGVLLVIAVVMVLGFTPLPREPWWRQSQLLPGFAQGATELSQHLPPQVTQYLELGARSLPTVVPHSLPNLPAGLDHDLSALPRVPMSLTGQAGKKVDPAPTNSTVRRAQDEPAH